MEYRAFISLVYMIALPLSLSAQFMEGIHESMDTKPKIIFKFDTRKSFIDNSNVTVFGWKIGVEFDKRIRIGGGFNSLTKAHSRDLDLVVYEADGVSVIDTAILNFNYICYFIDYVIIKKPKWEISYPMQFGIGSTHYRYVDENSGIIEIQKNQVRLLEVAITGYYKLTKWVGLGMGAGYRFMLIKDKTLDRKFNSPIYIFKLKVFLNSIIQSFSKKKDEGDETSLLVSPLTKF